MSLESKQLIKFTQNLLYQLPYLDDLIDKAIEPLKDYTDTLSDLGIPIKLFISLASVRQKMMLKSFLINYANALSADYEIVPEETAKLEKYLGKKENLQFISEIIESGFQAKSVKCSSLLGIIAGRTIKEKKALNQHDIVLIETLKEMNDIDLVNFNSLIETAQAIQQNTLWDFKVEHRTLKIYQNQLGWPSLTIPKASLELTIEKLKRTGALSFGEGGIGSVGNARGAFIFSEYTEALYKLIKKTKII